MNDKTFKSLGAPFDEMCRLIIEICSPEKIILYNEKRTPVGEVNSAKFCVIISEGDSEKTEEQLYVEIDTPFPCDFLVYTRAEFDGLLQRGLSFANSIMTCGRVIYEAN